MNVNNKTEIIADFVAQKGGWQRNALIRALAWCLNGQEACNALRRMDISDQLLSRVLLRKVNRDINDNGFLQYHRALIESFIADFDSLPYNRKQTCGYYLNSLHEYAPIDIQSQMVQFFIRSRYVALRNRGYKILMQHWNSEYTAMVLQAWKKHREYQCALLIVERFPESILLKEFSALESVLERQRGSGRLYIRAAELKPSLLRRLQKRDPITFAYVLVKTGKTLSPEQATAIFEEYKLDRRIGLFIWCLGQMQMWSVLEVIAARSESLKNEEFEQLRNRYGIRQVGQ